MNYFNPLEFNIASWEGYIFVQILFPQLEHQLFSSKRCFNAYKSLPRPRFSRQSQFQITTFFTIKSICLIYNLVLVNFYLLWTFILIKRSEKKVSFRLCICHFIPFLFHSNQHRDLQETAHHVYGLCNQLTNQWMNLL